MVKPESPTVHDNDYRSRYRPRWIRSNLGLSPLDSRLSVALTDPHEIGSPSKSSTRAWTSRARMPAGAEVMTQNTAS
jgi:hypothetical protein